MIKLLYVLSTSFFMMTSLGAQTSTLITGVVEHPDGSPERGAAVSFHPYGPSSGLRVVSVTNERGEFSLGIAYVGAGLLSASKVDEGYPDAVLAFYALSDYKSAQEVNPQGLPINGIKLKLSEPAPWIDMKVVFQGKVVDSVQIAVRSKTRPGVYAISTWDPARTWSFVIPKDPVTITVTASGYDAWTYTPTETSIRGRSVSITAQLKASVQTKTPQK